IEITQMLAAQDQIPAQGQNALRLRVAALALFDADLAVDQLGHAEPIGHLFDQHDACVRGKREVAKTNIEFTAFAPYCFLIHLKGDSFARNGMFRSLLFVAHLVSPFVIFKEAYPWFWAINFRRSKDRLRLSLQFPTPNSALALREVAQTPVKR